MPTHSSASFLVPVNSIRDKWMAKKREKWGEFNCEYSEYIISARIAKSSHSQSRINK